MADPQHAPAFQFVGVLAAPCVLSVAQNAQVQMAWRWDLKAHDLDLCVILSPALVPLFQNFQHPDVQVDALRMFVIASLLLGAGFAVFALLLIYCLSWAPAAWALLRGALLRA
jgi:hypothetical protein